MLLHFVPPRRHKIKLLKFTHHEREREGEKTLSTTLYTFALSILCNILFTLAATNVFLQPLALLCEYYEEEDRGILKIWMTRKIVF